MQLKKNAPNVFTKITLDIIIVSFILSLLILLYSCGGDHEKTTTTSLDSTQNEFVTKKVTESLIEKNAVRKLFDNWMTSQNKGDFLQYKGTYALKFWGVKRVGDRVYNFNAKDWLLDRERMFQKSMIVNAEDVKISILGGFAIVNFVQTWSSGSFTDKGQKQLFVQIENSELKIYKEEMLESKVLNEVGDLHLDNLPFYFVHDKYLVLDYNVKAVDIQVAEPFESSATIQKWKASDKQVEKFKGQKVQLFGDDGKLIDFKIEKVYFLTMSVPFGVSIGDGHKINSANEFKELAGDRGTILVTPLPENLDVDIVFALPEASNIIAEYYYEKPDLTKDKLYDVFKNTPRVKSFQKDYEIYYERSDPWFENSFDYGQLKSPNHKNQELYMISANNFEGCAGFDGLFAGIWIMTSKGLKLITPSEGVLNDYALLGPYFKPKAFVDINKDGFPEVFGDGWVLFYDGEKYQLIVPYEIPFYGCPC